VAKEIVGQERNSWRAAKKIAEWVQKEMTPNYEVGFASAKEILKNREGDCSEHTVLTVTLCRAVGIPARAAVGVMSAYNIFAYHMWSEIYVGRWIGLDSKWLAVDKKSGQYYTDATHLKFGRSVLDENIFKEMIQSVSAIIGQLKLEIIDYHQDQ
jgi:transglutaminase-like putative cysteine protease